MIKQGAGMTWAEKPKALVLGTFLKHSLAVAGSVAQGQELREAKMRYCVSS
jgi:hypothetical protein